MRTIAAPVPLGIATAACHPSPADRPAGTALAGTVAAIPLTIGPGRSPATRSRR